jgi:hypothetical protein
MYGSSKPVSNVTRDPHDDGAPRPCRRRELAEVGRAAGQGGRPEEVAAWSRRKRTAARLAALRGVPALVAGVARGASGPAEEHSLRARAEQGEPQLLHAVGDADVEQVAAAERRVEELRAAAPPDDPARAVPQVDEGDPARGAVGAVVGDDRTLERGPAELGREGDGGDRAVGGLPEGRAEAVARLRSQHRNLLVEERAQVARTNRHLTGRRY